MRVSAASSRTRGVTVADPDPEGPLRRSPVWIFDNQVEHASREMKTEFGLIILTILTRSRFERDEFGCGHRTSVLMSLYPQDLNESLILAQNQRWRRA